MASSFNGDEFKGQYDLQNAIQTLCTALGAIRAGNAPLVPTAAGTPLGNLLQSLNVVTPAVAVPYTFDLANNISIDAVQTLCDTAGVQFIDVQKTASGRAFYDTTMLDPNVARNYRQFSRPESADTHVEHDRVRFIDGSKNIIDWSLTLPKLKKLFKDRIYTVDMVKDCLLKLVHKYHPEQAMLLEPLTADGIATHLQKLDSDRDKSTYYRTLLLKTYRMPEDDLPAAMARIQIIIDKCYPAANPAFVSHRSTAYRTALLSFLPDELSMHVLARIKKFQAECLPLTDEHLYDYSLKCEIYAKIRPTSNLLFGRLINNIPAASYTQLNSLQTTVPYQVYRPYPNPYAAYPSFLPLETAPSPPVLAPPPPPGAV